MSKLFHQTILINMLSILIFSLRVAASGSGPFHCLAYSSSTPPFIKREEAGDGHPCLNVNDPDSLFKKEYKPGWYLCMGKGSFTDKDWPRHAENLLSSNVHGKKIKALLYWLLDSTSNEFKWNKILPLANLNKFQERAKFLTVADINNLMGSTERQISKRCKNFRILIGQIENFDKFSKLNSKCFEYMLKAVKEKTNVPFFLNGKGRSSPKYSVGEIYAKFKGSFLYENDHDKVIIKHMSKKKVLPNVPENFLETLFRPKLSLCSEINENLFEWIIQSKKRASILNEECSKHLNNSLLSKGYGELTKNLPNSFFRKTFGRGLHADFMTFATEDQVSSWGLDDGINTCNDLKLFHLTTNNIKKISPFCFKNAMKSDSGNLSLGNKWASIKNDVLSGLSEEELEHVIRTVEGSDVAKMTIDQKQSLLAHSSKCGDLKEQTIMAKSTINSECFGNMTSELQSKVMRICKQLPDDILTRATSDKARSWIAEGKHGISVLNLMTRLPKTIPLLSKGLDDEDRSVCKIITVENYKKDLKPILRMLSPSCKAMIKTEGINLNNIPKDLWGSLSIDSMKELAGGDWTKPKPNIIESLIATGQFCSQATSEIINVLPMGELRNVNAQCLFDITDKAGLDPQIVGRFSDDAYSKLFARDWMSIKGHGNINPIQFSRLSKDVENKSNSALLVLEPQDLNASRLAQVSAQFISVMNSQACKGIDSKEKISAIRPEALTLIPVECFKEIPTSTLQFISPDQIQSLGKESKDEKLFSILKKITSKLNSEQNQALDDRLKKIEDGDGSWACKLHPINAALILTVLVALFA